MEKKGEKIYVTKRKIGGTKGGIKKLFIQKSQ